MHFTGQMPNLTSRLRPEKLGHFAGPVCDSNLLNWLGSVGF